MQRSLLHLNQLVSFGTYLRHASTAAVMSISPTSILTTNHGHIYANVSMRVVYVMCMHARK